jgi:hypothetical protein
MRSGRRFTEELPDIFSSSTLPCIHIYNALHPPCNDPDDLSYLERYFKFQPHEEVRDLEKNLEKKERQREKQQKQSY